MDRIINIRAGGNYISKDNKNAGVRGEANVTRLRITFDDSWDGYAKKITFWDARGVNPVERILTTDYLENIIENTRVYLVPIPAEPMAETGVLTFVIEGTLDEKVQRSFKDTLVVSDAPIATNAGQPIAPTPTELEQLQISLEAIKEGVKEAAEAKEEIVNMSVSYETLSTGEEAFVDKTEKDGVVNLHFGLPAGGKGDTGDSGVYIGDESPTDPDVNVWISEGGSADEGGGLGGVMMSVKAFGAKGDGVTDDTNALRAAARSGEAIFFPAGTYLLLGQIDMSADINWIGEGEKSVIKLMPYDRSRLEEYGGNIVANCYMIYHPNGERYSISLQGIVLDANKQAYAEDVYNNGTSLYDHTTCLDLHNPKSVYLNNVEVRNALIEGCYILAQDGGSICISNCSFHDNGEHQVDASGLHIEGNGTHTIVSNCEFNYNGFHGLLLGGTYGASISNVSCCDNGYGGVVLWGGASHNTLSGVYCVGNHYGLMLKSTYNSNTTDEGYDDSWMVSASGNTINALTTEGNYYGIVFGHSDNNVICGWNCVLDSNGFFAHTYDKDITGLIVGNINCTELEGVVSNDEETAKKIKLKFITSEG